MKSKILKTTGITLLIIVTFLFSAPWLFKGKISSLIRARINKDLRAHVNFSDLDISLFRHFPRISFGLENLQVVCVGEFQGDTLITVKQFDLACDIRSLLSGDSIRVYSITVDEPRLHAVVNKYGHTNWNILRPETEPVENIDSSASALKMDIQSYAIHKGFVDYLDERKALHVVLINLEHRGRGNFSADQFTLKTSTTADAVNFDLSGAIPYHMTARTNIDLSFHVENKTHTWSFNTDQVSFNDLKLHTEGFFQWVNDSSYNMNIRYKVPSTKFKNVLSMLPSVYQKDFASIDCGGQVNFNGYIKGKYDEKHLPAYHTNFFVREGSFKYPDLPISVENINLGLQIDNPDGQEDHLTVNISEAHAEINHNSLDLHLLVKNLRSKPFIDFGFVGKLDLANISQLIKLESGTHLSGLMNADVYAKGNIPESENHKKDGFQSGGNFDLKDFQYTSNTYPGGINLNELLLSFNSKNVQLSKLSGAYSKTDFEVTGSLNNFFDFALSNNPLKATLDLKADEINLRDWIRTDRDSTGTANAHITSPLIVPDNIDLTLHAEAEKFHFDNLDLQDLTANLLISEQTIHLTDVKARGMDGEITLGGTYSTVESKVNPEIALNYDVKGLDIQKTFFAFNTIRKIMPVAKFMAGNINARMSLNGTLNEDMTTNLQTLSGEGSVELTTASVKAFGPMDKLAQSLDITRLKDVPLKDVKADFAFKNGRVTISPYTLHTNDIDMEIAGSHGFDQSLDYGINLKVPRSALGNKGNLFVKNVVTQAADKGIPVKLKDAVSMNVKMSGTINSPDVKTDMDAVVDNAASDLKKEVNDFVNAKLDSAKQLLHHPSGTPKKPLIVQTSYKPGSGTKTKKTSKSTHKNTAHVKTKKKHKKAAKNYSTSLKKEKSVVSNNR
jgi:hypothetical protein